MKDFRIDTFLGTPLEKQLLDELARALTRFMVLHPHVDKFSVLLSLLCFAKSCALRFGLSTGELLGLAQQLWELHEKAAGERYVIPKS